MNGHWSCDGPILIFNELVVIPLRWYFCFVNLFMSRDLQGSIKIEYRVSLPAPNFIFLYTDEYPERQDLQCLPKTILVIF